MSNRKFLNVFKQKARKVIFSALLPLVASSISCGPAKSSESKPQVCEEISQGCFEWGFERGDLDSCNSNTSENEFILNEHQIKIGVYKGKPIYVKYADGCTFEIRSTSVSGNNDKLLFPASGSAITQSGSKIAINSAPRYERCECGCKVGNGTMPMTIANIQTGEIIDTGIINDYPGLAQIWGDNAVYQAFRTVDNRTTSDIFLYDIEKRSSKLFIEDAFIPGGVPLQNDNLAYISLRDGFLHVRELSLDMDSTIESERFAVVNPLALQVAVGRNNVAVIGNLDLDALKIYSLDGQLRALIAGEEVALGTPRAEFLFYENFLLFVRATQPEFEGIEVASVNVNTGKLTTLISPPEMFRRNCSGIVDTSKLSVGSAVLFVEGQKLYAFSGAYYSPSNGIYDGIQIVDLRGI